ncbi:hypothetical protein Acsp04_27770 [Actinomadura sp. NBRC 104425]|uniref:hypothetical protein n=1 Tax=Actinomadura sp. NBRC 104425 TaxID=3032204 RepID=UPI0024A58198|nr:hypothetical protein [Actinomadura sp. NBRC 104425]GLZ12542.1 hypothetical protein Acsp04_27770 [Actinomadura sp. NBRC 104425]
MLSLDSRSADALPTVVTPLLPGDLPDQGALVLRVPNHPLDQSLPGWSAPRAAVLARRAGLATSFRKSPSSPTPWKL